MRTRSLTTCLFLAAASVSCSSVDGQEPEPIATSESALVNPIATCNQDPRVTTGMVPLAVCAGARVFFDETFNGNGRTCGTCHAAANNLTIDPAFIAALPPSDPLFVFQNPAFDLAQLETSDLFGPFALIRENVDGFEHVDYKFVSRSTPHTLSMATSIARDPGDNTSGAFSERTGWGGDGAPGNGSLRAFVDGAIKQHYPTNDARTPGSFRLATEAEKDQLLAYQLATGRTADINLVNVTMTDTRAANGRSDFMNPFRGRCNHCHNNAGAKFAPTGLNRNFDTGLAGAPSTGGVLQPNGSLLFDGGFGGQNKLQPDFAATGPVPDSFGDGTFSTPPLIEAADTAPLFHTNGFGSIENGVSFYGSGTFANSPAAQQLNTFFGAPLDISGPAVPNIGAFLRVLNASFNLAQAAQRLQASHSLNVAFWAYRDDIQKGLLKLAAEEVKDARDVLAGAVVSPALHPTQQTALQNVLTLLSQAVAATNPAVRRDKTAAALSSVQTAKSAFGTGMTFTLGTGNLMF